VEDTKIIELFWERSENAISEADAKYGKYCYAIAYNILYSEPDSEECVNDTYLRAWETVPPEKPNALSAYLGRIREISRLTALLIGSERSATLPLRRFSTR
jgi:RNA polymerase sigma-70 factor (ECF subfamily)